MAAFGIVMLLVGLAICCVGVLIRAGVHLSKNAGPSALLLVGAVLSVLGVYLLRSTRAAVFDRQIGWFYRGKRPPSGESPGVILLTNIHALQVLGEDCSGGGQESFRSFELNLVLSDGTRHNIVDYKGLVQIREDAGLLARFLNVPVWDA